MSRDENICKGIVVSHTHWDREWYLPKEEFRYWLVQAIDRLLTIFEKYPDYRFTLDGQTVPLVDYLEVRPEKEEQLRELVQSGRLLIGPWYIQPDEFLVSGEGLIRNLLRGYRVAQRFGGVMKDGYVPDSFGHIAQLPQLLQGFGINTAFITRGADLAVEKAGGSEFLWQAPDGSRVFTHVMGLGYCAGAFLSADFTRPTRFQQELIQRGLMSRDAPPVIALLQALCGRSSCGVVLIPNGCDHLAPQADILEVLQSLNEKLPQVHLRQGTLSEFAALVQACKEHLAVVKGEFRTSKRHPILSGVYSTRMYIKQKNTAVETLLERYAEPLTAIARLLGRDLTRFLRVAWDLMLQNQAHDSICGTSIDSVHREMMVRYERVEAIAHRVIKDALGLIGEQLGGVYTKEKAIRIAIFNPCPWNRSEEAVAEVLSGEIDPDNCVLLDPGGQEVPFVILRKEIASVDVLSGVNHCTEVRIAFPADLPPLGIKLYRLVPGKRARGAGSLVVDERTLENEFYRVEVEANGTLSLLDKESGQLYQGLCFLEDAGDAGDEYNYSPPVEQEIVTSLGSQAEVQVVEDLPWKGTLKVHFTLMLPSNLAEGRQARALDRTRYPVTMSVSLQRELKRVDITIEVENNVRDHRLRVGFPLGCRPNQSLAEDAFWVIDRPVQPPAGEDWVELPPTTHPQRSFVAAESGKRGMAILNQGLPEYELTGEGILYVTLIRGVGWLSRVDLSTRKGHAGPPYETPDAQCLGHYRFELAIYTYSGSWERGQVWKVAHAFRAPPIGVEVRRSHQGSPSRSEASLFQIEPAEIVLSTIKPPEEGEGLIIRLYNPTRSQVRGFLKSFWDIEKAELVNLNEKTIELISNRSTNVIPIELDSGAVKTLRLWVNPVLADLGGHSRR